MTQNITSSEHQDYDCLFGGSTSPVVTGAEILTKGQKLKRGAVLGYVPASKKLVLVDKTAVGISREPYAVLANDTDATDTDVIVTVYYTGEFNTSHLTFAPGTVASDLKYEAVIRNLYFNNVVKG